MGVTVQHQVGIRRRLGGRDVNHVDAQAGTLEIERKRPLRDRVAVPPDHLERLPPGAQFIQQPFATNIPQVPNLIRAGEALNKREGQFVMRIRYDGDAYRFQNQGLNSSNVIPVAGRFSKRDSAAAEV